MTSLLRTLAARRVVGPAVLTGLAAVGLLAAARPAVPAPAVNAAAAAVVTHRVRMVGDERGYRFEPARLTVAPGDRVTFVMVSGGPHNVEFLADSVPAAARDRLAAAMPDAPSALVGPLLLEANSTYTVSFAGLPAGSYRYVCTPHVAMDMKGTIVVRAPAKRARAR